MAEVRLTIDRRKAHASHQRGHMPPSNGLALSPQEVPKHSSSGKRLLQMKLVHPAHQGQLRRRYRRRLVVRGGPGQLQKLALSHDGYGVSSVDHRFALSKPALMSAPSNKSFSRASWPSLA